MSHLLQTNFVMPTTGSLPSYIPLGVPSPVVAVVTSGSFSDVTGSWASPPVDVRHMDRVSAICITSGTLAGTFSMQVSNDPGPRENDGSGPSSNNVVNWYTPPSLSVDNGAVPGQTALLLQFNAFRFVRINFSYVSGSGPGLVEFSGQGPHY